MRASYSTIIKIQIELCEINLIPGEIRVVFPFTLVSLGFHAGLLMCICLHT